MTLKQLTFRLKKKSAGRNSSGRITVFHRGGGSKRLHRKIDFQRSTSSIGLVQRIDYDPNRSSWIALIRWLEAMKQPETANSQTEENAKPFLGRREKNLFFFKSHAKAAPKPHQPMQTLIRRVVRPSDFVRLTVAS